MRGFLKSIKERAGVIGKAYKDAPKNVVGLAKEVSAARKSKKTAKQLQEKLIIAKAQKKQVAKYGRKMTPSRLRLEAQGGFPSEEAKHYMKAKKGYKKILK